MDQVYCQLESFVVGRQKQGGGVRSTGGGEGQRLTRRPERKSKSQDLSVWP